MSLAGLKAATDRFGAVLAAVGPDRYADPTPCDCWTVLDLVDHVVGGNRWAALILHGEEGRAALAQVRAGVFSPDRRDDVGGAAEEQFAAFSEPGALERTVRHVFGPVPASTFLQMRIGDVVVHTWDLARAVGADERLPDDLVAVALGGYEARGAGLAATGMFAPIVEADPDGDVPADPQDRLLRITGRRP